MFERYTEKARRVIFFARYEASQFGSPCIETEHLLLGLLREDKSLVNRFLRAYAAVASIRKQIEDHTPAREKTSVSVDLPLSQECKRVLVYAAEEAGSLHHEYVETSHFLLGLLREENCYAAAILRERGLSLSSTREELRNPAPPREPEPIGDPWRTAPLFALSAVTPRLRTADPSNASGFHEGRAPGETQHGTSASAFRRTIICRNMTMARFAESLPRIAPAYIGKSAIVDATGLEGAWDFTLSFSPAALLNAGSRDSEAGMTSALQSANIEGAISLFDALEQQLGLELRRVPPLPEAPKELSFRLAEVFVRAAGMARKAGTSEIGIDILLASLNPGAASGLSEIDGLLAAFADAVRDAAEPSASGAPAIALSIEAKAVVAALLRGGYGLATHGTAQERLAGLFRKH